jgi:hypothetical protein
MNDRKVQTSWQRLRLLFFLERFFIHTSGHHLRGVPHEARLQVCSDALANNLQGDGAREVDAPGRGDEG